MTHTPSDNDKRELWNLICGSVLGQGSARTVYEHCLDSGLVLKVESGAGSFQNVLEWETWEQVRDTEHARWFAPCVAISPCGGVLVQRRTVQPKAYPDLVPNFFTDLKLTNFGTLLPYKDEEERFVCHDYGFTRLMGLGLTKRMAKPNWWRAK
jgi:hypothetical protein